MNDLREKNVVNAKDYIEFLNIADKTRPFIDAGLKDIQEDGKLDHKEYLLKILPHVNDIVRMRLLGESNEHRPGDAISDSE